MFTQTEKEVMNLSRTLIPLYDIEKVTDNIDVLMEDVEDNANDYLSYNSSFYSDGKWWTDEIEECFFMRVVQKVGDYVVLRILMLSYYNETCPLCDGNIDWDSDELSEEEKGNLRDEWFDEWSEDMWNRQRRTEIAQVWFTPKGKIVKLAIDRKINNDKSDFDAGWNTEGDAVLLPTDFSFENEMTSNIACEYNDQYQTALTLDKIEDDSFALEAFAAFARQYTNLADDFSYLNNVCDPITKTLRHWKFETLSKIFIRSGMNGVVGRNYHTIKIAHRNGYNNLSDEMQTKWMELLNTIEFCNGNLQDPRVYMPEDLDAAMKYWSERRDRKILRERQEEEYRDMVAAQKALIENRDFCEQANKKYLHDKQPFLKIRFDSETLEFKVLQNVEEFCEEGIMQHHCVFRCKYYDMPDYVVMTCRNKVTGLRESTVTVDVKTGRIVANLNKYDKVPVREREIANLVMENMPLFLSARQEQNKMNIQNNAIDINNQLAMQAIHERMAGERQAQRNQLGIVAPDNEQIAI